MRYSNGTDLWELVKEASKEKRYTDISFSVFIDPVTECPVCFVKPVPGGPRDYRVLGHESLVPLLKELLLSYAVDDPKRYVDGCNADEARKYDQATDETSVINGYVYLLKSSTGFYKIGRTRDPKTRIGTMHVVLPFEIEIDHLIECEDYKEAEILLHNEFAKKRIRGEWFALDESDVNEIKNIKRIKKGGMAEVIGQPTEGAQNE